MLNASNSCMLRLVLCASFLAIPALVSANNEPSKYIGPGSCAATSCHGSVKPIAGSRILQNEYSTWIIQDKHSRAYQALTGDVAERMARILKLGAKAEEAPTGGGAARTRVRNLGRSFLRKLSWSGIGMAGAAHDAGVGA